MEDEEEDVAIEEIPDALRVRFSERKTMHERESLIFTAMKSNRAFVTTITTEACVRPKGKTWVMTPHQASTILPRRFFEEHAVRMALKDPLVSEFHRHLAGQRRRSVQDSWATLKRLCPKKSEIMAFFDEANISLRNDRDATMAFTRNMCAGARNAYVDVKPDNPNVMHACKSWAGEKEQIQSVAFNVISAMTLLKPRSIVQYSTLSTTHADPMIVSNVLKAQWLLGFARHLQKAATGRNTDLEEEDSIALAKKIVHVLTPSGQIEWSRVEAEIDRWAYEKGLPELRGKDSMAKALEIEDLCPRAIEDQSDEELIVTYTGSATASLIAWMEEDIGGHFQIIQATFDRLTALVQGDLEQIEAPPAPVGPPVHVPDLADLLVNMEAGYEAHDVRPGHVMGAWISEGLITEDEGEALWEQIEEDRAVMLDLIQRHGMRTEPVEGMHCYPDPEWYDAGAATRWWDEDDVADIE
jgi:hypothetical protein